MSKKVRVLFVCMGNICRSPTAHASFRSLVKKNNLSDKILVDSAGTHAYHVGKAPDIRAQQVTLERGTEMTDLRARKITADDLSYYDYILVMDRENLSMVLELADGHYQDKIKLFLQFARKDWGSLEVPDPYFGGDSGFIEVFSMIEDAAQGLLDNIKSDLR